MRNIILSTMTPPFDPFSVFVDGLLGVPGIVFRMLPWWGWILVGIFVFLLLMEKSPTLRILVRRAWKRLTNRSAERPSV